MPPVPTLPAFSLDDLAQFTRTGQFSAQEPPHVRTLFTQTDHVHEALKYLLGLAQHSLVLTMFGFDDEELDGLIRGKLDDDHVYVQLSLDRSQAKGVHEREILKRWSAERIGNSVTIGTSAQSAIAHMKAGVVDGRLVFDGSTNWSMSGEGAPGARAQNNSLVVIDSYAAATRYRTQLDIDHDVMKAQMLKRLADGKEAW